jgi:hypothetical protein
MRHLTETDSAKAELPIHRMGTSTTLAPRIRPNTKLRSALRLRDQCLLGHELCPFPLERKTKLAEQSSTLRIILC